MKKPDRVEVGQWYVERGGDYPFRVTSATPDWNQRAWLTDAFEYLGSGPHPEPSEWMIETLAEHGYEALDRAGVGDNPWSELTQRDREMHRAATEKTVRGVPSDASATYRSTVLSLYSILRSLGKW